jgi:L,D-transpeptidase catalytic domain
MQLRQRRRPSRSGTSFVVAGAARRRGRRWPWALGAVAAVVVAALAVARFAWPGGSLRLDAAGLPQVHRPGLAGRLVGVSLRTTAGASIPVVLRRDGTLAPTHRIAPGTQLVAQAEFRRPGWIGWLVGGTQEARLTVAAPSAAPRSRWLRIAPGVPVRIAFDVPVRAVRVTGAGAPKLLRFATPRRAVVLGRLGEAGSVGVSAVPQAWERLPAATEVTWFPPGTTPVLLARPGPGGRLGQGASLRLRFSQPLARLLHGRTPQLQPAVPGSWRMTDSHTLVFTPRGYGFGLDGRVRLTLPVPVRPAGAARTATTLTWSAPAGSELRLEQLLALLGYLPLRWTAAGGEPAGTLAAQVAAAVDPPAGRFDWRYPNTPAPLVQLWHEGTYDLIDRAAIMMFEDEHHLTVDGFAGQNVWQALISDRIARRFHQGGYSYVYVHSTVPQSLNLWHNGNVILTSPGNTGVPAAPTKLGSFPVFEHIPVGTMSGTNPDGSHYNDPGIRWISYFNGGDAIHAFNRASFGTPQSLGCVELPLAAAAQVWPYTPIGTLVTVER